MLCDKKLFLFDIDGTLAVGNTLFDGSRELLSYIDSIGGASIFITNNSTKSQEAYVEKFSRWNLHTVQEQFITSSVLAAMYLQKHFSDALIFVMGTCSFYEELQKFGLHLTTNPQEKPDCVIVGYDSELSYRKLEDVCQVLFEHPNLPFLATNPDLRCPAPFGFIPDCGAICHMIEDTTGRTPLYLGKPNGSVIDFCLEQTGFSREETIVVGDRLYTDIACGRNGQVDTCLILAGETQMGDLIDTPHLPTYCFSDVETLLQHLI